MTTLTTIIDELGVPKVADLCGISVRAVYKWRKANTLPRTEFTGETTYSEVIASALNFRFSIQEILDLGRPKKAQH